MSALGFQFRVLNAFFPTGLPPLLVLGLATFPIMAGAFGSLANSSTAGLFTKLLLNRRWNGAGESKWWLGIFRLNECEECYRKKESRFTIKTRVANRLGAREVSLSD